MYEKMYEQTESMFKPLTDIMSINLETLNTIREKQLDLVSGVMADTIEHAKGLSGTTDMDTICDAQKSYWETVQEKVSASTKDTFELLSDSQEKIVEMVQESVVWPEIPAWSDLVAAEPAKTEAKKASGKKATGKKKPAIKTAAKVAPQQTETIVD